MSIDFADVLWLLVPWLFVLVCYRHVGHPVIYRVPIPREVKNAAVIAAAILIGVGLLDVFRGTADCSGTDCRYFAARLVLAFSWPIPLVRAFDLKVLERKLFIGPLGFNTDEITIDCDENFLFVATATRRWWLPIRIWPELKKGGCASLSSSIARSRGDTARPSNPL